MVVVSDIVRNGIRKKAAALFLAVSLSLGTAGCGQANNPAETQSPGRIQDPDGTQDTGGIQNPGGIQDSGGMQEPGGTRDSGGMQEPGGTQDSGGIQNPGGTQDSGGIQNPGGTQDSGSGLNPGGTGNPSGAGGFAAAGGDTSENGENAQGSSTGSSTTGVYRWNRLDMANIKLPSAYDYRKTGRAPQIGNQGSLGTCWAFASLTALESSLLPGKSMTFAVDHMSMHNSFLLGQDEGGEYTMSMAYLLAWQGPVLESQDPYGDGVSPDGLAPSVHVQEIQVLPSKDYEAIKRAVYLRGGVQSSLYTSMRDYQSQSVYYNRETNSYCYIGNEKPNHDSVIVGWDDNYSRENFNLDLAGDGAFICTNSWGEDFGDRDIFMYPILTAISVFIILYTQVWSRWTIMTTFTRVICADGWVRLDTDRRRPGLPMPTGRIRERIWQPRVSMQRTRIRSTSFIWPGICPMQGAGKWSVPWIGGCCWQRAGWTMPVITRFRWIKKSPWRTTKSLL